MTTEIHGLYLRFHSDGRLGAHVEYWDDIKEKLDTKAIDTDDFPALDKTKMKLYLGSETEQLLRTACINSAYEKIVAENHDLKLNVNDHAQKLAFKLLQACTIEQLEERIEELKNPPINAEKS